MQEVSYIIALIGMVALLASGAAWWNVFRQPQLQSAAWRLEQDTRENTAAIALVAAFGLSLVAAILAIFAWMF
jgi:predicted lysophospholipase L1 biosynthesis ABC-type transport system permease subunit